jgi:hypothetical protein
MAFYDTVWFTNAGDQATTGYYAVAKRPQNAAVVAGQLVRQFTAPALNNERVFVCIVAGTTANVADATWVLTRGARTVDGTATWQECTGASAVNGDAADTVNWTAAKAAGVPTLGAIIKRNNGASYWICSVAGTMGASEPAWPNDTAGTTQADGTTTWTCLGVVGNFAIWAAPHARLANAFASTWGTSGNKFWLADNHAETQAAAMSLSMPGSSAVLTTAVCVDRTAALPPTTANFKTGASISTTANNSITFAASGIVNFYYEGIAFNAGDGSLNNASLTFSSTQTYGVFKNCAFNIVNTNSLSSILLGGTSTPNMMLWDNCPVSFANTGQVIAIRSLHFEWRNTPNAIAGATIPLALFAPTAANIAYMTCRGVDFSALNTQLLQSNMTVAVPFVFEDCKFNPSLTRYGTSNSGYFTAPLITTRCDSAGTNYKGTRDEYSGSQVTEIAITRVGGATDNTTPASDKIVTNTQCSFPTPYRLMSLPIWNDTIGANVTVTVYGTINAALLPNNDEIWIDVQYLGSAASPLASFKSSGKSHVLAAAAPVAADGSVWNGGGSGAGWTPFKLVATLTAPQPQMKGYMYVAVRAAKPSTTYYIDPTPVLT